MEKFKNLNIDLVAPTSDAILTISSLPLDELLSLRKDLFDEASLKLLCTNGDVLVSRRDSHKQSLSSKLADDIISLVMCIKNISMLPRSLLKNGKRSKSSLVQSRQTEFALSQPSITSASSQPAAILSQPLSTAALTQPTAAILSQPLTAAASSQPPAVILPPPLSNAATTQPTVSLPSSQPTPTIQVPSLSELTNLPELSAMCGVKVPTFRHVPKGARNAWAGLVTDVLSSINKDPSDLVAWRKLFMLPRCVLSSPANGGHLRWREIQKLVKLRIRRWLAGEISELWNDVLSEKDSRARLLSRKKKKSTRNNLRKSNAIRARRAVEDGQYRKAIQALSSGGLAPITSDVVKEMQAKHPQSSPPSIRLSQPQSPIELVDTQVIQALRSFPNGSAPGPSNLRANHLKEAVSCPSPGEAARATQALTRVVSLLCDGRAPSQIVLIFVELLSYPSRRKVVVSAQLLLVRYYDD